MTQPETLPCPFCGSKDIRGDLLTIYCNNCKVNTGDYTGATGNYQSERQAAIDAWNRRPAPETQAPVESAPALAPFEKLVEELRAEAEQTRTHHGGGTFRLTGRQRPTWSELSDEGELLLKFADRLSAVVEEVRGK